jgi:integrase
MARVNFTAARIAEHTCPEDKGQAFIWDSEAAGLGLRATANGAKTYVFQSEFQGKSLRMTIGRPTKGWNIKDARERAKALQRIIDSGRDPREVKAETVAADVARRSKDSAMSLMVRPVWDVYMVEGKPRKKAAWKPRYRADLLKAAAPGGEPLKRGNGKTKPGHLAPLMTMRLSSIDQDVIRDWYTSEARRAPIQAARAVAMFSGFLTWCATRKEYRSIVDKDAARATNLADVLPASPPRTDALEPDQLPGWFRGTEKLSNRHAAAYLQALLLTGARREEMGALKWADIDFRWHRMSIADKVDAKRVIPLAPYLETVLRNVPRSKLSDGTSNPFVFASPVGKKSGKTRSASGRITEPRSHHADVLADAGIPHVSIHGLRRSFALLGEAAGAPAGAIAQIMGHRPSAIAERYKPRGLDALREYLTKVEVFILEKAGIPFDRAQPAKSGLRLVSAA